MAKDKLAVIEELAMDCLIDLIDKEYVLTVRQLTGYFMIKLEVPTYVDWIKIREDYLFFIQIMTNDYKLAGYFPFRITRHYNTALDFTLEMIERLNYDRVTSITVFLG